MESVEEILIGEYVPDTITTKAVNDYNNYISTLNTKARAYNNTTYSDKARCVGSLPSNPDYEAGMYVCGTGNLEWFSSYNNRYKGRDNNEDEDRSQMEALGILDIGDWYAMASSYVTEGDGYIMFGVNNVWDDGANNGNIISFNASWGNDSGGCLLGIRPVFHLKDGIKITGGSGTQSDPYTLGT